MSEGSLAIEEMKGSLETAAITIGQTLAPIITKVAEFVAIYGTISKMRLAVFGTGLKIVFLHL